MKDCRSPDPSKRLSPAYVAGLSRRHRTPQGCPDITLKAQLQADPEGLPALDLSITPAIKAFGLNSPHPGSVPGTEG